MGLLSRMSRAATALTKYYFPFTWRNKPSLESPINEVHLNHMEDGINEMDNRILLLAQDKADAADMANVIIDFTMDDTTGVMTFTRFDGSTFTHDTAVEKIALNCYLEGDNFVLELADGTKQKVSLSKFIDTYTFTSTDRIRFTVNGKNISADIPDGKITLAKLEPTVMSTIRQYTLDAQTSKGVAEQAAGTAQGWAIGGTGFEGNNAKYYASKSQRYAVGGVEEGDAKDNAKAYCEAAKGYAEQCQGVSEFDGTAATVSAVDTQGININTATGTTQVTVSDAWEAPIPGLEIAGKSEQITTKGLQMLDANTLANKMLNANTGVETVNSLWVATDYIPVVAGQQYKLTTNSNKYLNYALFFDENKIIKEGAGLSLVQNSGLFTVPEDVSYVRIRFYNGGNDLSISEIIDSNPMLNLGVTAQPYEPYTSGKPSPSPDNPQEIVSTDVTAVTVTGAQLLDIPSLSTKNYLGVTYSPQPDGTVIATGTSTGTSYIDLRIQEPLPLGDYYISGCPNGGGGDGYQLMAYAVNNGSYKVIGSDIGNGSRFTVTDDNPIAIRIVMRLSISGPLTFKPMLNAGDTALPWEPYQSKTAVITLTEPLRGIGDYRDRIMCRGGVWGIERNISMDRLTEDTVRPSAGGMNSTYPNCIIDNRYTVIYSKQYSELSKKGLYSDGKKTTGYCNIAPAGMVKDWSVVSGGLDNVYSINGLGGIYIAVPITVIGVTATATMDEVNAAIKQYVADNDVYVMFVLDAPTWEPLPAATQSALNALTTYTGQTTITVTADGPESDITMQYYGQPGAKTNVQSMLDALARKVALELVSNTDLAVKLADYVAQTDIVQVESTATNKVPSSAYLKSVKDDINSNLADKLLIKNNGLWSGKNNADDYRNHNIIFYCNPAQGNLTTYNYPVNETGVFRSVVCNQFSTQTYVTISNALYQRIAADNSSAFSAWELK